MLSEPRRELANKKHGGAGIYAEMPVDTGSADRQDRVRQFAMRRVVHQHAYRSEGVLSVGEDFGDGVEIREVAAHPTRLPACASDIFAHAQGSCFAFEGKLDGILFAGLRQWRVVVVGGHYRAVPGTRF